MKKTLYIIQLSEPVHVSVTKYRKQSKQRYPKLCGYNYNTCLLVISCVNTSYLNTLLNYRSTLHCTTLYYTAQLSFISDFIPTLLSSFALFLFLLSDLSHNFDSVSPTWYKRLLFCDFTQTLFG